MPGIEFAQGIDDLLRVLHLSRLDLIQAVTSYEDWVSDPGRSGAFKIRATVKDGRRVEVSLLPGYDTLVVVDVKETDQ